uniref:glucuronosyltransferase n=1 Tax=Globodera rostochiensis TaxID=31243 RepID=A0A914HRK4_GLORO
MEEDGHEVHMLIPIRDENQKISDKNVEVRLNVQYFMPKMQTSPSLFGVGIPLEYDKIYLDIASDLKLMDKLRSEKFDVGITETFYMTAYSLAIFHFLGIPVTIATHSQPMAPFHLYLLGVLSKMKTQINGYIGLPTFNLLPSGEDRLELLNFKSREVREEQLKLRKAKVWQNCVDQTMEKIKEFINQDVDYQKLAEEKYFLNTFPSWVEMFKSTRFFFLNSLPEVDFAQFKIVESIEKVKFIGAFNLDRPSSLNTNAIQHTNSLINLTLGTKKGVILVSFGTIVDSFFQVSSHIIEALVETMEKFPNYLFIWKQPKGDLPILKEFKFKNVILQNWINQKETLAHPKTMAFVSHCGMNSVMEGTFYGVPMVCMPLGCALNGIGIDQKIG